MELTIILSELEAAIHSGISPELLMWLTGNCPKSGETRTLPFEKKGAFNWYKRQDLDEFSKYLFEKWPSPDADIRAHIPEQIKAEIRRSAGFRCSICPYSHNLEIAHIRSWANTKCNHPQNLLLLCPNHHTQYDFGYKPHASLKREDINLIKLEQVQARRYQWQSALEPGLVSLRLTSRLEKLYKSLGTTNQEIKTSVQLLAGELIRDCDTESVAPQGSPEKFAKAIAETSTFLAEQKVALKIANYSSQSVQRAVKEVSDASAKFKEILDSLDDEPCPHCDGKGQTGLVGDICKYCNGAGSVTKEELDYYDAQNIDESLCPHCEGKGTIGFTGEICKYCNGSQVVTKEESDNYNFDEVGEVACPHCEGRGLTGLNSDICIYCNGNCLISPEMATEYDPNELDEKICPHCLGQGTRGISGVICKVCNGSQSIKKDEYDAYVEKYGDPF